MLISIANSARTLFFFIQCTPFTQTPNCVFEKNEKVFQGLKILGSGILMKQNNKARNDIF